MVAGVFVMATFSFGLGFYGITVYVAALQAEHGWSAAAVSAPVTVYYGVGALVTAAVGDLYARFGPRIVVAAGSIAMAAGVAALGLVREPWQLYPAFLVMSLGWGSMSGAAINILVVPWFERRRGLALSIAFNGATTGGVVVAPVMVPLIARLGLAQALAAAALALAVTLTAVAALLIRRPPAPGPGPGPAAAGRRWRVEALGSWRFWSVAGPFALGLAAQVGVLTHLVSLVMPTVGPLGAAQAISTATVTAVVWRLLTGLVLDRVSARVAASATLMLQIVGLALLAGASSVAAVYAGCALFGLGLGNLTTLPGFILAKEWPREAFSGIVGLAVASHQVTFAFGPSLVGVLHDWAGGYGPALTACMALQAAAAVTVLLAPTARPPQRDG